VTKICSFKLTSNYNYLIRYFYSKGDSLLLS